MSLQIKVPPVGESITEVTLASWLKKDGDAVQMDEVIAELESDKATFELTAEKAGTLKTIAKEGDVLPIGAPVCTIEEGGAAASAPAVTQTATPTKEEAKEEEKLDKTTDSTAKQTTYASGTPSPAAAKILAEKGIDPANVNGNGVAGRITKEDAMNAQSAPAAAPVPKPAPVVTPAPVAQTGERT